MKKSNDAPDHVVQHKVILLQRKFSVNICFLADVYDVDVKIQCSDTNSRYDR